MKLKLPQPLPVDKEGDEELPPTNSASTPPRETRERIYSEPNTFTVRNYAYGCHGDNYITQNKMSLSSSGFASLDDLVDEESEVNLLPRQSSVPSLKSHTLPGYEKGRLHHRSSPPLPAKPVKPVLSTPIAEVFEPADPAECQPIEFVAEDPERLVKLEIQPRKGVPPPVPQRPPKYTNMGVANGNDTDDVIKRVSSTLALPGNIPNELEDVFSTAETPIGSCNEETETEKS